MELYEKLYELRRASGMSQEELAESRAKPSPNGRAGFHLDKDTTPFPR